MPTDTPAVSVILPTYNRASVVGESIQSVLDQTYENLELIVVDDASTDDTSQVVAGFDDPRVRYISHERNRGANAARNTGIEAARNQYIAFQDSDDEWRPQKLEKQMAEFKSSPQTVGVVYTALRRTHDEQTRFVPGPNVSPVGGDLSEPLRSFNFISTQTAVVRSQCFDEVGMFDENLPALQDWELWLRIAEHFEFRYVDEPLVDAQLGSDSISTDFEAVAEARDIIVRKHRQMFSEEVVAAHLFWSGHGFMKSGDPQRGRENLREAIATNARLLYLGSYLLSLFGPAAYNGLYKLYKGSRKDSTRS